MPVIVGLISNLGCLLSEAGRTHSFDLAEVFGKVSRLLKATSVAYLFYRVAGGDEKTLGFHHDIMINECLGGLSSESFADLIEVLVGDADHLGVVLGISGFGELFLEQIAESIEGSVAGGLWRLGIPNQFLELEEEEGEMSRGELRENVLGRV